MCVPPPPGGPPPDRTTGIGQMIDSYLKQSSEMDDRAIHLLFSANRWECARRIESDLSSGVTIIADRYAFSGIAFSAAKGLNFEWLLQPDIDLPSPDLTLFLTVPPSRASTREDFGAERYETVAMQTRVREEFGKIAERVKSFQGRSGDWEQVDGEGTIEQVGEKILRKVEEVFGGMADGDNGAQRPIQRLWR